MSGVIRSGQRQNNFNNYNNKFNNNRQGAVRNRRFVNNNKNGIGQGPGVKNMNSQNSKGNRDIMIRRNIEHMQQVAQKKRVAQEMYYSQGRSPLVRTTSGPFVKQDTSGRVSVQQRLGNKSILRNSNNNHQQQHNFVPRRPNQPFVGGLRSDKMARVQNLQKKKQRFQNMNGIKTVSSSGKVVYLQHVRRPANYTVRVENDVRKPNYKHHVAKDLNPQLQQEIKLIQNKNMRQIISPMPAPVPAPPQVHPNFEPIDRLPIVATSRTLHERFSMI